MPLADVTDYVNQAQIDKFTRWTLERNPRSVAILGLSYKVDTVVTTESLGTQLMSRLPDNIEVQVHGAEVDRSRLANADVTVLATAWPSYRELRPSDFRPGSRLIDVWGVLDERRFQGWDLLVPGKSRLQGGMDA
jgi:UDP-N-acetyl-D-mannosaminuronate dehydrogenase